jgi:hypothetical protein
MRLRQAIVLALAGAALSAVPATEAATSWSHYYIDELTVDNTLESKGIEYHSRHIAVDNASCLGLRRYGVRTSDYQDTYWRFRCDVNGADNHFYDVQVSTTNGPRSGYWYWHFLSVKQLF